MARYWRGAGLSASARCVLDLSSAQEGAFEQSLGMLALGQADLLPPATGLDGSSRCAYGITAAPHGQLTVFNTLGIEVIPGGMLY